MYLAIWVKLNAINDWSVLNKIGESQEREAERRQTHSEQSGDAGDLFVDGLPHVVEGGRPQDDPGRAAQHRNGEQPQEEAVQHHRDELPVLNHLNIHRGWLFEWKKKQ